MVATLQLLNPLPPSLQLVAKPKPPPPPKLQRTLYMAPKTMVIFGQHLRQEWIYGCAENNAPPNGRSTFQSEPLLKSTVEHPNLSPLGGKLFSQAT